MLSSLHIENLAVIKNLDIDFKHGFNVLTGETGAGKSILLDSINMILGSKTEKELVRTGEETAFVSAVFENISNTALSKLSAIGVSPDEDGLLLIERTLSCDGRSAIRVNSRTITKSLLSDIGNALITIHGQNDNRALLNHANHLKFLDLFADTSNELSEYRKVYDDMNATYEKIKELIRDESEKARYTEILKFQISDIENAKIKVGEEEKLTEQKKKIQSFEQINKHIKFINKALYRNEKFPSAFELMQKSSEHFDGLCDVMPQAAEFSEKLKNFSYELESMCESAKALLGDMDGDIGGMLDKIESRLDLIGKIKRKYGSDESEVLKYLADKKEELQKLELSDELIKQYTSDYNKLKNDAEKMADVLYQKRKAASDELSRQIESNLSFLDMSNVKFFVDFKKCELSSDGAEKVEFYVQTNKGEAPRPLEKTASGGELSRIMLAVKNVFKDKDGTDTMIFDEIDSGVSGRNAEKIGIMLHDAAKGSQIICVTHSAQIASKADCHFKITKSSQNSRTETKVELLDYDGRIDEISRIMGGINITENIRKSAKESLDNADLNFNDKN
ncbi:MAG: DNA repair protein RecN [Clostridia bacterium]|nr:DNA repair protein RecN [Clostridia bacterium]